MTARGMSWISSLEKPSDRQVGRDTKDHHTMIRIDKVSPPRARASL